VWKSCAVQCCHTDPSTNVGAEHSAPLKCSFKFMELFESLPVKISQHEQLANKGCLQARDDWRRYFGTVRGFVFCLGKYNAIAVAVPDCLPERIEAVAYASEIAFLYDGIVSFFHDTRGHHLYVRRSAKRRSSCRQSSTSNCPRTCSSTSGHWRR
jgi:hypothetical protein